MIIDNHSHLMYPLEKQIDLMKEAGIDKTILFPTIINPEKASTFVEFESEYDKLLTILSGKINSLESRKESVRNVVDTINSNKELFWGFGTCPAGEDYKNTSDWIEEYIINNGLIGIGEIICGSGQIDKIENIFKVSSDAKRTLPLWIHTFNPLNFNDIKQVVEFAKKYSNVNVIFGHGGGYHWLETLKIIREIKNIYIDISATFTTFSLKFMSLEIPERTLFGSDAPYGNPLLTKNMIEYVIKDKTVQKLILGENIFSLLFFN